MYWQPPSASELALFGFAPDEIKEPEIELWEENRLAFDCFIDNRDQWLVSTGGPFALNLVPVYAWLGDQDITGPERRAVIADVRLIAAGALQGMQEASKNAEKDT